MRQFDFVLCKHNDNRKFLFRAPAFSGLKKDDNVMVDTRYGTRMATVVSCATLDELEQAKIDFIAKAMNIEITDIKEIKQVLSKIIYMDFDYSKEWG